MRRRRPTKVTIFKHPRTPGSNNEPILLIRVNCLSLCPSPPLSLFPAQMSFPVRHTLIVRSECFLIQDPQLFLRRHRHRPAEKRRCVAVLIGFSRDIAANLPTTRTIPPAPYLYSAISYRRMRKTFHPPSFSSPFISPESTRAEDTAYLYPLPFLVV